MRGRDTIGISTWPRPRAATSRQKSASPDVHFELFDATHMGIDYRYPKSLAYLSERLR
jgi:hypothetical protein